MGPLPAPPFLSGNRRRDAGGAARPGRRHKSEVVVRVERGLRRNRLVQGGDSARSIPQREGEAANVESNGAFWERARALEPFRRPYRLLGVLGVLGEPAPLRVAAAAPRRSRPAPTRGRLGVDGRPFVPAGHLQARHPAAGASSRAARGFPGRVGGGGGHRGRLRRSRRPEEEGQAPPQLVASHEGVPRDARVRRCRPG